MAPPKGKVWEILDGWRLRSLLAPRLLQSKNGQHEAVVDHVIEQFDGKAPKFTKNGKRIGRPPDDEKKKAKAKCKKFDSPAYAVFLEDLAGVVREELGLGPEDTIRGLQDGARFHWGEEAKQMIKDKKMDFFTDFPAYSPDLNPIENLFGILSGELAKLAVKKASKSVKVTVERAHKLATKVSETDYIKNMVDSMPNRLEEVIKAKGGPTRY